MSHWYPSTFGTKEDGWYWITHPDLPGTFTRGERSEEDTDWNAVSWWAGPFPDWEAACDNLSTEMGNAGSYDGPWEGEEAEVHNKLSEKLVDKMTAGKKIRPYW